MVQAGDSAYLSASLAEGVWQNFPVVLESEHYGLSRDRGAWGEGSKYLEALEAYHASYVSIHWFPREFLESNRPLIEKMNRRLGYRLQLHSLSYPSQASDKTLTVEYAWRNAGVAPCYPGGFPAITLKDSKGGIALAAVDESLNMRTLPVGPPDKAATVSRKLTTLLPPFVKPGKYDLFISVGSRQGTPQLALPLPEGDLQLRYKLGSITVE
jgi:hypothetical protein